MKYIETVCCTEFKINHKHLIYIKDGYIYIYPNNIIKGKFINFTLDDFFIYAYDIDINESVFYDIESLKIIFCNKNFLSIRDDVDYRKERELLFGQYRDSEKKYWVFVDSKQFSLIKKYEITIESRNLFLISDSLFLSKDNEKISLKEIDRNEILWQHTYSELFEGKEIHQYGNMVVHNEKLFIYLADNKDSQNVATISLDINSGKILDIYKGFAGNLFLNANKLYVASYETVKILDLETNQITELDFTDILKQNGLQIHWNHFLVEDNLLYFADGNWATTNKLGIIDLDSRELLWHTEININDDINKNIIDIKVLGNRLYVHCSDDTLHIFENDYSIKK